MLPRTSILRRYLGDRSGVAAIEFAMIAPLMAAAMVGTLDVSNHLINRGHMHSGVRSGIQYLMDNGRDLYQLQSIVENSWSESPGNAVVTTERYCLCVDVRHACDVLCTDDSAPESYFSVSASGTLDGYLVDSTIEASEDIRVR